MPARSGHDLVLLDLDGTISDPIVGIWRSFNFALEFYGYAPVTREGIAPCIGPPLDEGFHALTGVTEPGRIRALVAKYRERYAEVGYSENVLYPGIPEALGRLHRSGMPLGVCTSKRVDFAEQILVMFGLRPLFRFVDGGDVGIPKWRQMEGLLARGAITRSTVMVGDRAVDLTAAHKNGLPSAGVLWGHGSRDELERERPAYLLAQPADLAILSA